MAILIHLFAYIYQYTANTEKRGHEFKRELGTWDTWGRGTGEEKGCDYIL